MKTQTTASRIARKAAVNTLTALVFGLALSSTASAFDGTITFSGAITESPCVFSATDATCYSGSEAQKIDINKLRQVGSYQTISSNMSYAASNGSVAIVTVSYF